jgi:hypothetical protein
VTRSEDDNIGREPRFRKLQGRHVRPQRDTRDREETVALVADVRPRTAVSAN